MKFENYRKWLAQHDFLGSQEFDYLDSLDLSVIICANVDKTCEEIMEIIEDRAEKVVEELDMIIENEVLSRMGRWRVQAHNFAQDIYDKITDCR